MDNREHANNADGLLSKVPEVTFVFLVIKICATTLGETGADALLGKQRTMLLGG
jgi:Uncharacterized membrane-anchored protein conserved in bacteria